MEKSVNFTNNKGNRLSGVLSIPENNFKGLIVIFAHGLGSSKESEKYKDFGRVLNEKNIGILRFDFFGHGESEGQFEDITIDEGIDDVLGAIKFVKSLGFTKIGLVGTSFGGISSIMAATITPDLKFLGLLAPVTIPEELSTLRSNDKDAARLKTSIELDTKNNGHKVAHKIKIPVLIIHGEKDQVVPLDHSQRFCSLLSSCKLEVIKGGDHQLRIPEHYLKVLSLTIDFIQRYSNNK